MQEARKFTLEGLNCATCAAKIEKHLKDDPRFRRVELNMATGLLKVEAAENTLDLPSIVEGTVHRYEPHVKVKDPEIMTHRLGIVGVVCANCANKIDDLLKREVGVEEAFVDFAAGQVVVTTRGPLTPALFERIEGLVQRIEPHVHLQRNVKSQKNQGLQHWAQSLDQKRLLSYGLGLVLFMGALFLDHLALYLAAYILVGHRVLRKAASNIQRGQVFDENFLMVIATFGAYAIGEYPEAVAVMLFYEAGEMMQDLAVNHSRRAVKSLLAIRPDRAQVLRNGQEMTVDPEEVAVGETLLVRPGERIPLDGVVLAGRSTLDTSALTGESMPRTVSEGDALFSGSINQKSLLTLSVTAPFSESTIAKILRLVEEATSKKAKTEQFITKFARYYTPAVVLGATLLALLPPLLIPGALFSDWLYRALVFLVISCPCALVVSIPLGFFAGIGRASRSGILIKGGNFLEAFNDLSHVVFDKTGTLMKCFRWNLLQKRPVATNSWPWQRPWRCTPPTLSVSPSSRRQRS